MRPLEIPKEKTKAEQIIIAFAEEFMEVGSRAQERRLPEIKVEQFQFAFFCGIVSGLFKSSNMPQSEKLKAIDYLRSKIMKGKI